MCTDFYSAALPPAAGLSGRADREPAFAAALGSLPAIFRLDPRPGLGVTDPYHDPADVDPEYAAAEVWAACCRLAGDFPAFPRVLSIQRGWDRLHWLLSATRRGEPAGPEDRAVDAAFDAGDFADEAGQAFRFLDPGGVRAVAAAVRSRGAADVLQHCDPDRMRAAGVCRVYDDSDEIRRFYVEQFDQFRRFYLWASAAGAEVLVVKDW